MTAHYATTLDEVLALRSENEGLKRAGNTAAEIYEAEIERLRHRNAALVEIVRDTG